MSSPAQPTTTTQIQKTELPAWVDKASQENYAFAQQVADRPFQQYEGPRVAGLSAGEQAAPGILQNGMNQTAGLQGASALAIAKAGAYQPQQTSAGGYLGVQAPGAVANVGPYAAAPSVQGGNGYLAVQAPGAVGNVANAAGAGAVQGGQGYQAIQGPGGVADVTQSAGAKAIGPVQGVRDVTAQRFDGSQLGGYLNPFTDNVVNSTLGGMRDNLALSSQKADDAARGAGAYGSSRSGVMQAVLQSQGAKDMASTEAGLRSAAYTDAAGRLMADNSSALSAALANQQSGLTTQGRQLAADQSNQSSALSTEALNAGIRQGNQSSALTTQGQRLQADTSNASNFLANAAQRLQGDVANQNSTLQTQGVNADIGKANQASALQTAQQQLSAGTTNANNYLQNAGQALQGQISNQGSANTNNALNASVAQGNQSSALETAKQQLSASLANQGAYGTAAAQNLASQTANQTAGLQAANLGLSAGTALGGLADSATNNAGKNALLSSQLGANDRSVEQARLDTAAQMAQEKIDAPLTALNTRLAALGMSPYGKTTNTTETKTGGTSSNGALSAIGGIMSFLPFLFSDEKLKKNIKTVGTTESGAPLKSYEYKGFMAKKMPGKQLGVLAQDMEKIDPAAVRKQRGDDGKQYKAVDYSRVGRGFMGRKVAA